MSRESQAALERARLLVEEGQAWRARDVLTDLVETEADAEALVLLGHVLHGMGDLPRAGAAWFAAGTRGPEADAAVAAWREQTGDDFAAMWRSLPEACRAEPRSPRVEALRTKAVATSPDLDVTASPLQADVPAGELAEDAEGGTDAAQVIGWIVAAAFVVCAVIGVITVLGWLVPGE